MVCKNELRTPLLQAARAAVQKALDIDPENEEIIETLSTLCFNMGDFDSAMEYCLMGLDVNPFNAHFWNNIGVIYFNQSDFGDAEEAFEQAITINPYYYNALFNLKDTYEQLGNAQGVAECAKRLNSLNGKQT